MSLKLKTKSVRFEFVDDDVESVVTLSSDDDQDILVRKLKRVIALVEGEQGALPPGVPEYGIAGWTAPVQGPEVSGGDVQGPQPANGWAAAYGPPALPDRLKGEVELIQPGEDA